jgi:hypothetical protein
VTLNWNYGGEVFATVLWQPLLKAQPRSAQTLVKPKPSTNFEVFMKRLDNLGKPSKVK